MKISVDAYTMTPSALTVGTEGSSGSASLEFCFSREWEGLIKKVSFYTPEGSYVVLLEEDRVQIPDEVMQSAGRYSFALAGYGEGRVLLSLTGMLTVLHTREPAVTPPGSPTPTEMQQIYEMMERAIKSNEDAALAAEAANDAANSAKAAAEEAAAAGLEALQAAKDALDAAAAIGDSLVSAQVNGEGHLILSFEGGSVQDAGSVRGRSVEGGYVGMGSSSFGEQHISLGFRPALLAITRVIRGEFTSTPTACVLFGEGLAKGDAPVVELTEDGFTVYEKGEDGFNEYGCTYRYTALSESIPTDMLPSQTVTDCFDREDDASFAADCQGTQAPKSFGQLMIGPGGRLFVSVLGHGDQLEGNDYGSWLPIIDDDGRSGALSATTFSGGRITEIANGLALSLSSMGQGLSDAINQLGNSMASKADTVNGNVQMHGSNVMGLVDTLIGAARDPSLLTDAGIYGVVANSAWQPESLPAGETLGVLEVLPNTAGLLIQRFTSANGKFYYRLKNLLYGYDWTEWKEIAVV